MVASKGGEPTFTGLVSQPESPAPQVEINVGPRRLSVTAKPVLPDDPDYQRLWNIVNDMKGNKNRYIGVPEEDQRARFRSWC